MAEILKKPDLDALGIKTPEDAARLVAAMEEAGLLEKGPVSPETSTAGGRGPAPVDGLRREFAQLLDGAGAAK